GMLEVDKGGFSIEPFLYVDGRLITWAEAQPIQELEQGYLPIPSVVWRYEPLLLRITAFATGKPGASTLYARYLLSNSSAERQHVSLFLAMRPFQVNPPWQTLNVIVGGASPIRELSYKEGRVRVNREKVVLPLTTPDRFGAARFEHGPITDFLAAGKLPAQDSVIDPFGYASGALEYIIDLPPHDSREIYLAIPFHEPPLPTALMSVEEAAVRGRTELTAAIHDWQGQLNRVEIQVPPAAERLVRVLKSNLAYILINRAGPAIHPGPRTYARSWIRDGALTSSALLSMGYPDEVREFIRWYAGYQFPDGKIPCCVDHRGADPLPEHDSHGEFIYAIMEYYRYTHDVGFLNELWPAVVKTVDYIDFLRRQRLTDAYRTPELRQCYGLVPESVSHEGYLAHPVHSYWDDFFTLRGLKDAATMAVVLGETEKAANFAALRDAFHQDLLESIRCTMGKHGIEYLPASAELGDFDPNSTAIALDPGGEQQDLPQAALRQTFDNFYTYFRRRADGEVGWDNYTPYEIRVAGALVRLGQRQRALDVLDFFLADQRPAVWNQWPEIVWSDPRAPNFIGDLPHTWIGSDYIRVLRSLFAFEEESDQSLVIAAGVPYAWLENTAGISVKRLPTYHGTLNYTLQREAPGKLRLTLTGDIVLPPGHLVIRPPMSLRGLTVNGKASTLFDAEHATITEFPAEVVLEY
ncbi:MAG TPA: hypothetical protein VES89_06310, partial [Candidatus Competibacteraceae bacterium]|nr:hypothetical protein [Candidatus Competibacteraceae bacterium]